MKVNLINIRYNAYSISIVIIAYREELEMNCEQFAGYLSISPKTLRKLEKGKVMVSHTTLIHVLSKLQMELTISITPIISNIGIEFCE